MHKDFEKVLKLTVKLVNKQIDEFNADKAVSVYSKGRTIGVMIESKSGRCVPCEKLKPFLNRSNRKIPMYTVWGSHPRFIRDMRFTASPLVIFYKNGKEVSRFVGLPGDVGQYMDDDGTINIDKMQAAVDAAISED